jgi:hypothetical protein
VLTLRGFANSRSLILASTALVSACSITSASLDDGPLVQVAQASSASGAYEVSVLAHAPTLTRGNYTLQYVVTSAVDGTPVDGLELTVVPWMPAMGHGTPIKPTVSSLGSGAYELDDIDLFMPGLWQLRTTTAEIADRVEPSLQVD